MSVDPLDQCYGSLDQQGCRSLTALPSDFMAVHMIKLDGVRIDSDSVRIETGVPEAVQKAAIGKRIGEIGNHGVLGVHRLPTP